MSSQKLSHTLIIIIISVSQILLAWGQKMSEDNQIRKRDKRQFFGGHFGMISVPFFNLAWGKHYSGWHGPWNFGYGWGAPWHSFGPRYGIRRRFWRRRWENWDGFHESFGGHEFRGGFGGPWHWRS